MPQPLRQWAGTLSLALAVLSAPAFARRTPAIPTTA